MNLQYDRFVDTCNKSLLEQVDHNLQRCDQSYHSCNTWDLDPLNSYDTLDLYVCVYSLLYLLATDVTSLTTLVARSTTGSVTTATTIATASFRTITRHMASLITVVTSRTTFIEVRAFTRLRQAMSIYTSIRFSVVLYQVTGLITLEAEFFRTRLRTVYI